MEENCYLFWNKKNLETLIIDPGEDAEYIIDNIQRNELNPIGILATHGHVDHIMAGVELELSFDIPFYIHKNDKFLLNNMRRSAKHFLGIDPGPPPIATFFQNKLEISNWSLEIISVPGHTPGSVCYFFKEAKSAFVGDLIFAGGEVGRSDFSYSEPEKLAHSIKKIKELPKGTTVYPGHGESFVI